MNRYPRWKNFLICIALLAGFIYTLPNFYGEAPAVQVSIIKSTLDFDPSAINARIERALRTATPEPIAHEGIIVDANGVRVKFADTEIQMRAKEVIENEFVPDKNDPSYVVALNLLPNSPAWLTAIHAQPMYLGLDLRGGVHFLLQVDMPKAVTQRLEAMAGDLRMQLRDKDIRYLGVARDGDSIRLRFREAGQRDAARAAVSATNPGLQLLDRDAGENDYRLDATLGPQAAQNIREAAIRQNISTLHNRINELGGAEPVIQQQGTDRIVVQLPGVQDVGSAKEIIGRTATLELRMVEENIGNEQLFQIKNSLSPAPYGTELYLERDARGEFPILLRKQVELTGENLTDAQPGFDENHQPAVHLTLDSAGAKKFYNLTSQNVGKRMAIVLVEKGKGEVVTAPVIRAAIGGGRVQISGSMNTAEASKIALLLRAGALAAPMDFVEERVVGPSLGKENIEKGFHSTLWGFLVIVLFMSLYYMMFGIVSSLALGANLLLLVALLSMLQATLTLPGIAAMALTMGMAIDSNVLINERVREELRNGSSPQAAIFAGYERAWDTILDSNITTLIAGLALLLFGSGPVRGFAVVHCLGILTSMFSAILVSRMLINFIYGYRRKLPKVSIGTVWKPAND